jgi:formate-dependent nitrite reductase cytochrome c552 subunit
MTFNEARFLTDDADQPLVEHPVSCVDCHAPNTMELRVTRPAFKVGIRNLKAFEGVENYDVNRDANRQEMRTYVCAQCHVEYYFEPEYNMVTRTRGARGCGWSSRRRTTTRSASPTGPTPRPAGGC